MRYITEMGSLKKFASATISKALICTARIPERMTAGLSKCTSLSVIFVWMVKTKETPSSMAPRKL